jgi:hypothetical protein
MQILNQHPENPGAIKRSIHALWYVALVFDELVVIEQFRP